MNGLKICYISSEVAPFTATGGLAYTSQLLPVALKDIEQDIRLMMPKYKLINERKYVLREVIRLREVKVELANDVKFANGKTAFLPNSKVHVYFLSVPEYFNLKGIYKDPQTGKAYPDNAKRFAYFCKSVLETLKLLFWQPDIIHCAGWSTALVPFYLKTHYKNDEFFKNTRTVLTVHDFKSQGIFPLEVASQIGISKEYIAQGEALQLNGSLNFLKAGIHFADVINTVSEQTLEDIITDNNAVEVAYGLNESITHRKKDIVSILNGADYTVWNPENDKNLSQLYDVKTLTGKDENKVTLCQELNLPYDPSIPLLAVIIDDFDEQGGPLLLEGFQALMELNIQLIILGRQTTPQSLSTLTKLAEKYTGKFVFLERLDTRMLHLLFAGADMMLLPSHKDIQDTIHLRGMRYGTVPIVYNVGALADSIKNVDPETGKGNGFVFSKYQISELLTTIQNAFDTFKNSKLWTKIRKNCMRSDFSWKNITPQYLKLYEKALKKNRS